MPSRRNASLSRPATPFDSSMLPTTTTTPAVPQTGAALPGGPLHSTPPARTYAQVAASPPASPTMQHALMLHAAHPAPPGGVIPMGLMGPATTPMSLPAASVQPRPGNQYVQGASDRATDAAGPSLRAESSAVGLDGGSRGKPIDKGKGRGPPGPPSPTLSPGELSAPSTPRSPTPAYPDDFEVHGSRFNDAEEIACAIAESIITDGARYDDFITDGIGRDGLPLPGRVPDYEQRKRKRARVHTPSSECDEPAIFYARALEKPEDLPRPPTPHPSTIVTARELHNLRRSTGEENGREDFSLEPPPSNQAALRTRPPPSTQPRQPTSRLVKGGVRPARGRKSLPASKTLFSGADPMDVDILLASPVLRPLDARAHAATQGPLDESGSQLFPVYLTGTATVPSRQSATGHATVSTSSTSTSVAQRRDPADFWADNRPGRSWSDRSENSSNIPARAPLLPEPFCPDNMSHRPPNYRPPTPFPRGYDGVLDTAPRSSGNGAGPSSRAARALTQREPPQSGQSPSPFPQDGRFHTYVAQMATLQAYAPQGFGFTPAPAGGFGPHDFGDPEHLIYGMASDRVEELWQEEPTTTALIEVHGTRHPSPQLIQAQTDLITTVVAAATNETDFRVIGPEAEHPTRRKYSPSTYALVKLRATAILALVTQRIWSSELITLSVFRRVITLPDFLCLLEGVKQHPELDIARTVWETFNGPHILPALLRYLRANPKYNRMHQEVAANIVLSSLRVHVTALNNGNLVAAIYCTSPAATVAEWRVWRDTILRAPFHVRDDVVIPSQPSLCGGCHSASHPTDLCPYPGVPDWHATPQRSRLAITQRDNVDLGPSTATLQGDQAGPSTYNRSLRGRGGAAMRGNNGRQNPGRGASNGGGKRGGRGGAQDGAGNNGRHNRDPY
ncbi:uncharacterized protein TRAVEDRAFT_50018 [Trametes versicolor FP-101664 SS1]|uniref:uncharacterized protein n=1 Tax=Trametes versicolor (strain FP-101664) TaxID=717944 RepID=UPI00046236A6|nr:uncharacterized protein TRAVEDRAFT_50018 [Trametes versicolor FP-101664 SS1]EIW55532.1 hypothetical protein TRAVEDRAFT_50018 [Trametes versicolor FP-101664 SS1]